MAYCAHCGSDIANDCNFCPYCGRSVAPGNPYGNNNESAGSGWDRFKTHQDIGFHPRDIAENRYMAALAYLSVLVLIPLFLRGQSPYVRYHCNQGLSLLIVSIAITVAGKIIPFVGGIISALGGIFVLICMVIGILNALNGKASPLPVVGNVNFII